MCLLCDQARARQFQANSRSDGWALFGLSIAPADLIDESFVAATRQATATDDVLDYYLHTTGGAVTVSGGGFGEQTIQSVSISSSDQAYLDAMLRRLDNIIDLDFRRCSSAAEADVDLYYDIEIVLSGSKSLGLATSTGDDGWELFVNYPEVEFDEAYRRYVLIHEFGHSLGLEHPFEQGDGDVLNGITDPWLSAYPEDTVMAYRHPSSGQWPDFFTNNDLNALVEVWGAETLRLGDGGQVFVGENYSEEIEGGRGDDYFEGGGGDDILIGFRGFDVLDGGEGDDVLRAGNGRDFLAGGFGSDEIYGGFGRNTYDSMRDGSVDYIFFKSDQWAENWLYGSAGNNEEGEKVDVLQDLDAYDRVFLQGVSDEVITVGSVTHAFEDGQIAEGLGIFAAGYLEAVYTGNNLSEFQVLSLTSGISL